MVTSLHTFFLILRKANNWKFVRVRYISHFDNTKIYTGTRYTLFDKFSSSWNFKAITDEWFYTLVRLFHHFIRNNHRCRQHNRRCYRCYYCCISCYRCNRSPPCLVVRNFPPSSCYWVSWTCCYWRTLAIRLEYRLNSMKTYRRRLRRRLVRWLGIGLCENFNFELIKQPRVWNENSRWVNRVSKNTKWS